jgi:hypothetical protein
MKSDPWNLDCKECESVESKYFCPVYNCSKHSSDQIIKWRHGGGCGGGLRLYENGKEKCDKCAEEELFCLWNCSCYDESKNQKQYSYSKLRNILSKLVGIDNRDVGIYFIVNVATCIKKQYNDHPEKFDE